MKNLLIATALMISSVAMAQGGTTAPAAGTPPAKVSKKDAKAQCLKEDKSLKGAKLNECIKGKTK